MVKPVKDWNNRIWENQYGLDVGRGRVDGARQYGIYGERIVSGSVSLSFVRESGMPNLFTVPDNIQLSFSSSDATDTNTLLMLYLDVNLNEQYEQITLNGTNAVLTSATDIRAINGLWIIDGPATGNVTATEGGVTHAYIPAGDVSFDAAMLRVPNGKRFVISTLYGGAASGTAAARVVIEFETTRIGGISFADDGYFSPVGGVAVQDTTIPIPLKDEIIIPSGEFAAFTFKTDKGADVTAGAFGWLERND